MRFVEIGLTVAEQDAANVFSNFGVTIPNVEYVLSPHGHPLYYRVPVGHVDPIVAAAIRQELCNLTAVDSRQTIVYDDMRAVPNIAAQKIASQVIV